MTAYLDTEIDAIAGWLKDGHSAKQIADLLARERGTEVTRNMMIGLTRRHPRLRVIGLRGGRPYEPVKKMPRPEPVRAVEVKPSQRPHPGNIMAKAQSRAFDPGPPKAAPTVFQCREIPLMDIGPSDCRWPVNDAKPDEQHLFCGLQIAHRRYCRTHYLRSIGQGTEAERSALRVLKKEVLAA